MEQPSLSADGGFGARLRCPWAVAGPGCSGGAWPGFEPTRRATHQRPGAAGVEGAGGSGGLGCTGGRRRGPAAVPVGGGRARPRCPWVAAGSGCGARGRRGPAAVPVGGGRARAGLEIDHSEPQARVWRSRGRAAAHGHTEQPGPTKHTQRPEHQRRHSNAPPQQRPGIQKTDIRIGCRPVVELGGFEPPTFSLRTRRATNCAIAPRTRTA